MSFLKENKLQAFIFCFAFLLFANTLNHDYAWDDSIVITENPTVKKGFKGIPELFIKSNSDYKADKYGYRPITLTSFAIEYGLFGQNPKAGHFFNVICFSLLCVLIYTVLSKIFSSYSNLLPFVATLVFIAHPIHCEVVANIKSRDEIFAFLFSLLSLHSMIKFSENRKTKYLLHSAFLFILAFLSKESAIVFLALIPLTLFYIQGFTQIKRILVPVLIMSGLLLLCVLTVKTYTSSKVGVDLSKGAGIFYENGILGNSFFHTDKLVEKLANAALLLLLYLKNFVLPTQLVYFSGYNQIPVAKWTDISVIFSAILFASLLVYAIVKRSKKPELFYSVVFYFVSISIYLHIVKTLADTMADRFFFVPSLAMILCFVFLLEILFKKSIKTISLNTLLKNNTYGLLKYSTGFILCLLSLVTFSRNKVWKNNEALISNDMPKLENCARAHQYYADMLQEKLNVVYNATREDEMIMHYKKSISISNASYYSYLKLSMYYNKINRINEAISLLDTMLLKFPKQADVYYTIGEAYYKKQEYQKSISYLKESKILAPNVATTFFYLSLALSKNKQYTEALSNITECEQKFGINANTIEIKSEILFDSGEINKSTETLLQLLNYGRDATGVYKQVIGRYQLLKMDTEAMKYYKMAREKGIL